MSAAMQCPFPLPQLTISVKFVLQFWNVPWLDHHPLAAEFIPVFCLQPAIIPINLNQLPDTLEVTNES